MTAAANRRRRPTKAPATSATLPRSMAHGVQRPHDKLLSHCLHRPARRPPPCSAPTCRRSSPAPCAGPPSPCRPQFRRSRPARYRVRPALLWPGARLAHRPHGCTCSWSTSPGPIAGFASACSSTAAASGIAPAAGALARIVRVARSLLRGGVLRLRSGRRSGFSFPKDPSTRFLDSCRDS